MSLITVAAHYRIIYCVKNLIKNGANPIIGPYQQYVWPMIARIGNVDLLITLFNHDIDKNSRDENGISILWRVVDSGNAEAVRYLLDLCVRIPTYTLDVCETQCEHCKENTFIIDDNKWYQQMEHDPCMKVICSKNLDIVKFVGLAREQTL